MARAKLPKWLDTVSRALGYTFTLKGGSQNDQYIFTR
jgi:hypothetical protein